MFEFRIQKKNVYVDVTHSIRSFQTRKFKNKCSVKLVQFIFNSSMFEIILLKYTLMIFNFN